MVSGRYQGVSVGVLRLISRTIEVTPKAGTIAHRIPHIKKPPCGGLFFEMDGLLADDCRVRHRAAVELVIRNGLVVGEIGHAPPRTAAGYSGIVITD